MLPIQLQNIVTCGYINRTHTALDRGCCGSACGTGATASRCLDRAHQHHNSWLSISVFYTAVLSSQADARRRNVTAPQSRRTTPICNLKPHVAKVDPLREPVFLPLFCAFGFLIQYYDFSAIDSRLQRQQSAIKTFVGLFRLICGGDSRSSRRTASVRRIMPSYEQLILLSASGCACLKTSNPESIGMRH
jgi:hypothetical protein